MNPRIFLFEHVFLMLYTNQRVDDISNQCYYQPGSGSENDINCHSAYRKSAVDWVCGFHRGQAESNIT